MVVGFRFSWFRVQNIHAYKYIYIYIYTDIDIMYVRVPGQMQRLCSRQ